MFGALWAREWRSSDWPVLDALGVAVAAAAATVRGAAGALTAGATVVLVGASVVSAPAAGTVGAMADDTAMGLDEAGVGAATGAGADGRDSQIKAAVIPNATAAATMASCIHGGDLFGGVDAGAGWTGVGAKTAGGLANGSGTTDGMTGLA